MLKLLNDVVVMIILYVSIFKKLSVFFKICLKIHRTMKHIKFPKEIKTMTGRNLRIYTGSYRTLPFYIIREENFS